MVRPDSETLQVLRIFSLSAKKLVCYRANPTLRHMEQTQTGNAPVRPTFLTVLCILTFLGSGWWMISNISNYMNANVSAEIARPMLDSAQQEIQKEASDNEAAAKIADKVISGASAMLDPAKMRQNALFGILANVLTLGGAFLMFQLRKPGFWVYVAGTLVGILSPILVYGASNLMSLGMSALVGFFGIIFIILYSLNLKYLK